jgi:rod shape-determining protein MreD
VKFGLTVLLALLLLTIESVVVRYTGLTIVRVDVSVAIVAFLALRAGTLEGSFCSFGIGYLMDLMSGRPTGLYTFLAVLVFLVGRLTAQVVGVRSGVAFALFAMAADAGHGLLAVALSWLTSPSGRGVPAALAALPPQILLTCLAAWLLYPLLKRIDSGAERPQLDLLR